MFTYICTVMRRLTTRVRCKKRVVIRKSCSVSTYPNLDALLYSVCSHLDYMLFCVLYMYAVRRWSKRCYAAYHCTYIHICIFHFFFYEFCPTNLFYKSTLRLRSFSTQREIYSSSFYCGAEKVWSLNYTNLPYFSVGTVYVTLSE